MDLTNFVTASKAYNIAEHARDRLVNSEEYKTFMNALEKAIINAAEKGSDHLVYCVSSILKNEKYDPNIWLEEIKKDLHSLGFNLITFENNSMTFTW